MPSRGDDEGSLLIHQDARIFLSTIDADNPIVFEIPPGRHAWLQVLRGSVRLNERILDTSDGAADSDELKRTVAATSDAEIMLFDLA